MSKAYLEKVRENTFYPAFRKFVSVVTVFLYLLAAACLVAGFVEGERYTIFLGIVFAVLILVLAIVGREVSLMLADIADATIEVSGRTWDKSAIAQNGGSTEPYSPVSTQKSASFTSRPSDQRYSEKPNPEENLKSLRTEADCVQLLHSLGYQITSKGNGWLIREPYGGKVKIADLSELLNYSNPKQFERSRRD